MKKILSFIIVLTMILSTFTLVSFAADVIRPNVEALVVTAGGDFSTADNVEYLTQSTPNATFDFRAKLAMANVQNALTQAIDNALQEKPSRDPYDYTLTGEFTIEITYPKDNFAATEIEEKAKAGTITAADFASLSSIYNVTSSAYDDATVAGQKIVKINLDLGTGVNVGELNLAADTHLSDIVFEVKNVAVSAYGYYPVNVSLTGNTEVTRDGATAPIASTKIEYAGANTATVAVSQPSTGGGGSFFTINVSSDKKSGTYPAGTEVVLSSNVKNAVIYYTIDGTKPEFDTKGNPQGTTKIYENPLVLNEDVEVNAQAVTSNFKTKSSVKTYDYKVEGVDVVIEPESGIVKSGQEVTISSKKGEKIYYTVDGSDPAFDEDGNPTGTTEVYTKPIIIEKDTTVKAVAVNEEGAVSVITSANYVVAHDLITDHVAYIQGDDLGNFNPETPVTRAEIATIFSRITIKKMDIDYSAQTSFSDVSEDDWFATAVAFMENAGIVEGYEDGTFRPNNYITRAEFATIASRYDRLTATSEMSFTDVLASHWAYKNINSAVDHGWVKGYEDGSFKPDDHIKRTEVVTVVNRMLGRNAKVEFEGKSTDGLVMFPDNLASHWAYYEVIESSNTHEAPGSLTPSEETTESETEEAAKEETAEETGE